MPLCGFKDDKSVLLIADYGGGEHYCFLYKAHFFVITKLASVGMWHKFKPQCCIAHDTVLSLWQLGASEGCSVTLGIE